MPDIPARNKRTVGLALGVSALLLVVAALATWTGLLPFDDDIRGLAAVGLGSVAVVDLLLGFWFFRSSLSS